MPRVTADEVTLEFETDIDVAPFIRRANVFVNQYLTPQNLSDDMLFELELLMAAHFACVRDPRENEIEIGTQEARVKFEGKFGMGLDRTRYGQDAKAMDPTGILANLDKPNTSFNVLSEYD